MEWKFGIAQRIRTGAALAMVFLLVLATNIMDSNHFNIVQKSLSTVYEDRLLAKDYIYKISRQLQLKKDAIHISNTQQVGKINSLSNDSIQVLVDKFSKTKLTETEAMYFESLQNKLERLYQSEQNSNNGEPINNEMPTLNEREGYFIELFEDLDALSKIQLEEGKREISHSNRAINTSNLISRFEIGVLIAIGLLIQLLIFIKPLK